MNKIRRLRCAFLIIGFALLAAGVALQLLRGGGTITRDVLELPVANNLKISCTALDLMLHSYDGDTIRIEYSNDLPLTYDTSEEGVLRLTQDASFSLSMFSLGQFSYRADIYLPRRSYRDFRIDTTSGDIFVDDIAMLSLDISTRSGKIQIVSSAYPITAVSQRGEVNITAAAVNDDIYIRTGSGDITLNVPDYSSYTLGFTTTDGLFFSDAFSKLYNGTDGGISEKYGSGRYSVTVETESGDFHLLKE